MVIHPDPQKTLVFAGDKTGQLGIWDALAESETVKDEDGEEVLQSDVSGKSWKLQIHGLQSVSCMKVAPNNGKKVKLMKFEQIIRERSSQYL